MGIHKSGGDAQVARVLLNRLGVVGGAANSFYSPTVEILLRASVAQSPGAQQKIKPWNKKRIASSDGVRVVLRSFRPRLLFCHRSISGNAPGSVKLILLHVASRDKCRARATVRLGKFPIPI